MAAKDFVVQALIFMLVLNAVPTMMDASGLDDAMGVEVNLGVTDTISKIEDNAGQAFNPNTGVVESFVSVTVAAALAVKALFESITAFPELLENLGVPYWITDPMKVIFTLIALFAVIYVTTGRRFGR